MKKIITTSLLTLNIFVVAQTTATLENYTLAPNSHWNGKGTNPSVSTSGSFTSGNVIFSNVYNGNFGGYWQKGWAYSNRKDSVTAGSDNQYSAITAVGYSNSSIYAIAQNSATIIFNAQAGGKQMKGFYITNSTYAYRSMKDGDSFAKKFGGATGNDSDWFKLKIQKYLNGNLAIDSVVFYLADYRFNNNAQDYIVRNWEFVDLTSLGNADSLSFRLTSSDNGQYGMNTPGYFCLDDFTTMDSALSLNEMNNVTSFINVFPNPAVNFITIEAPFEINTVKLFDVNGKNIMTSNHSKINISELPVGLYFIGVTDKNNKKYFQKLIKSDI